MMEEFKKALFEFAETGLLDRVKSVAKKYNWSIKQYRLVAPNGKEYHFNLKNGKLRLKRCA